MKISLLITSDEHPIYQLLEVWVEQNKNMHDIDLVQEKKSLKGGDILFLISCHELIEKKIRDKFQCVLLLHASDLPKGRGWSPHVWDVLNGSKKIYLCLLEANDEVDSGKIWKKIEIGLNGTELFDEINEKLFASELRLLGFAVDNFASINPVSQENAEATYFGRRRPEDSELDVNKSIASQFDLMRISDPKRYPAFFVHKGAKYKIILEKLNSENDQN